MPSEPPVTYPSKRDTWLTVFVSAGLLVGFVAILFTLKVPETRGVTLVSLSFLLLVTGFIAWTWTSTRYVLQEEELLVRSGPIKWRIPLAEIQEVRPTRNPLSSPALSLDRLEVRYGRGSLLMISPQDKDRFLEDVLARSPRLERQGDRLAIPFAQAQSGTGT